MFNLLIKRLSLSSLLGFLLFASNAMADFDEILAKECPKIQSYNSKGSELYKQKDYVKAREQFNLQVGWAESCDVESNLIATAYNNVAITYLREKQYLKAKAWLSLAAEDKKSLYNTSRNKSAIDAAQQIANQSITGEYWRYAGVGIWNTIIVDKLDGKYKINFWGYRVNQRTLYYGPNMGEFEVILPVDNNRAIYDQRLFKESDDECVFDFEFSPGQITLLQKGNGNCGFGMGVYAGGSYIKVGE